MRIEKFEDIIAWQKSKELAVLIYRILSSNRDYGFRDQLQRASISISNNIAEGFERHTNKEFRCFLYIAKGSCAEARSMLHVGLELKYINENNYKTAYNLTLEISRLLSAFIKTL